MTTTPTRQDDSLKQYLIDEFLEDYSHGQLSRRDALKRLVGLTASVAAANALLAACAPPAQPTAGVAAPTAFPNTLPPPATAVPTAAADPTIATLATATVTAATSNQSVPVNDPAIHGETVSFPSQGATISGYLARPAAEGSYPAVLVAHENRGLTPHIQDVVRRLAKAGYVALAVDLLSRQGGSAQVGEANVPGVLGNTPPAQLVGDYAAGLEYLKTLPYVVRGRYGMVGFCFGGGMTWRAATQLPELKAAVPYYGPNPPLADVPKINAAVLAQYGGSDARINAGIPAIEAAMQENKKIFQYYIYEGAGHAFNNDTGANYNAQAAQLAWTRTLDWFAQYLK